MFADLQDALQEIEYAIAFTRTYRDAAAESTAVRELRCLDLQLPHVLGNLRPEDGFAGHVHMGVVGFSPEPGGFGYYCREEALEALLRQVADVLSAKSVHVNMAVPQDEHGQSSPSGNPFTPKAFDLATLHAEGMAVLSFWREEQTSARVRSAYPPMVAERLPSDEWTTESGAAFPLYRLAGMHPDYDRLVREGIGGLQDSIMDRMQKMQPEQHMSQEDEARMFLLHAHAALALLGAAAMRYAEQAEAMACDTTLSMNTRTRMADVSASLCRIASGRPTCLRDAMQLMWLYALASGALNYGRMDVYLGDFLEADLTAGRLTPVTAQEMITSLWKLVAERNTVYNGRIILGGRGRRNPEQADAFAKLAMEATRVTPGSDPQLTLRWHKGMSPALLDQALSILGEGRTFPILYNDDINIPAVAAAFRISEGEAEQYLPYGCGEYIIDHASLGTPSGVINLLKVVELTLRNGRDAFTGRQLGLMTGELDTFHSFDDFFNAYSRQVNWLMEALAAQQRLEYEVAGKVAPFLLPSVLFDDCIDRGKPLLSGGVRHLGGTIETYGNINAANSLTALRRVLFPAEVPGSDTHSGISPEQLLAALDTDFAGSTDLPAALLACPKYGNDNTEADEMAIRVHEQVCHSARNAAQAVGLDSYLVVVINNSANTTMGKQTGASPDGRHDGEPMANANNPWSGTDRMGLTAMLHSLVKLDPTIHAGAVQNVMLSPSLFRGGTRPVRTLVEAYFAMGGTQAMISVVNHEDLRQAMDTPERYGHLFVRVGGFSARFVDLERKVQQEILSRTLY